MSLSAFERSARGLNGELTHPTDNVADLGEGALRGLNEADAVLDVATGDAIGADLRAHALEMARPAASSAADTMRWPEERRAKLP